MSLDPIEEKLLPVFAKHLFKRYVEKFGYSKAFIDKHEIPITLPDPPEEFYKKTPEGKKTICISYFSEMKARGYLSQSGGFYKFTAPGFQFGYESLHPWKCWHRNHWKWLYGVLLLGIMTIVATLINGVLLEPIKTLLQITVGN